MKTLRRTAAALVAPLALAACNEPTPPPTPCRRRLSPPTRWNRPRRLRSSSRLDPRGPQGCWYRDNVRDYEWMDVAWKANEDLKPLDFELTNSEGVPRWSVSRPRFRRATTAARSPSVGRWTGRAAATSSPRASSGHAVVKVAMELVVPLRAQLWKLGESLTPRIESLASRPETAVGGVAHQWRSETDGSKPVSGTPRTPPRVRCHESVQERSGITRT